MTVVDDILKELRAGTPLEAITKKYRSRSSIVSAMEIYEPELLHRIQEEKNELSARATDIEKILHQISTMTIREVYHLVIDLMNRRPKLELREIASRIKENTALPRLNNLPEGNPSPQKARPAPKKWVVVDHFKET